MQQWDQVGRFRVQHLRLPWAAPQHRERKQDRDQARRFPDQHGRLSETGCGQKKQRAAITAWGKLLSCFCPRKTARLDTTRLLSFNRNVCCDTVATQCHPFLARHVDIHRRYALSLNERHAFGLRLRRRNPFLAEAAVFESEARENLPCVVESLCKPGNGRRS